MNDQLISFSTAQLAKEKGFNTETLYFYTKSNSKMFGIDEKNRYYPIKNTSKKLYKCGEHATLNTKSVFSAPTQSLLQKFLRETHNIFVICTQEFYRDGVNYLVQVFRYSPQEEDCYQGTMLYGDNGEFKSFEDSLEYGLKLSLEMI